MSLSFFWDRFLYKERTPHLLHKFGMFPERTSSLYTTDP
ncbi:hypothetical protein LEP1GSC171_2920 [Leptospira santarosai str. HAI1380]|nr:hypothetical protein LEP1GSC171_2920 [Leptospira santarosai str. HAI1380]